MPLTAFTCDRAAIPLEYWHEALLARNCGWQMWAVMGGIAQPVSVLDVRRDGCDGYEVLTDFGWKRAVAVFTYQHPQIQRETSEQMLFG